MKNGDPPLWACVPGAEAAVTPFNCSTMQHTQAQGLKLFLNVVAPHEKWCQRQFLSMRGQKHKQYAKILNAEEFSFRLPSC